jgi:hypothetical protein
VLDDRASIIYCRQYSHRAEGIVDG